MTETISDSDLGERLIAAEVVAREAGALAVSMRLGPNAGLEVALKGTFDLCTAADGAVERLIRKRLADQFDDSVLGEEFGGEIGESLWVIDPIDGTYNFVHGLPLWCVSIGFVCGGAPLIGVIYNPVSGDLFAARKARGATLNGKPIQVSGAEHVDRPLVEVGWSNRQPIESYLALQSRLHAAEFEIRQLGSAALGLAAVACGRIDGYIEAHINSWDILAGLVLVGEAGGWTNDFLADGGLTTGNAILACTPAMQTRLSDVSGIA
jgi:myo-inositol-1(or 4)-monophosphatase